MTEVRKGKSDVSHTEQRIHAAIVLLVTVLAGLVFLPLVRTRPIAIHDYFSELPNWIRVSFGIFLCFLFTIAIGKLFSPRLAHLAHLRTHPPSWLALLLGAVIVAIIDYAGQLTINGYVFEWWHWPVYCLPSVLYLAYKLEIVSEIMAYLRRKADPRSDAQLHLTREASAAQETSLSKVESVDNAPWEEIDKWLKTDAPAKYDFLQNREVAHRLARLLRKGEIRSIGLVAPFGAGKTTVVEWIAQDIDQSDTSGPRFFTCKFSCWGFDSSASVIYEMLNEAIKKVSAAIDAFNVESLPETYRQTFSAGGDWLEKLSQIVLGKQSHIEQFERLSKLLAHLNARLLFIVEDLDRNDTRAFEIPEVLGFLERLKQFENFSFVLTGGLRSTVKLDFVKLCDHIEMLRNIDAPLAAAFISRIRDRCRDVTAFPHIPIAPEDNRKHWDRLGDYYMSALEELTLQQAVAALLRTPRALRHSLSRTYLAWSKLCGEVNLDQLIVLNAIRHGAPEAFNWLIVHWPRLSSQPQKQIFGADQSDRFKAWIIDQWKELVRDVEWSPQAVLRAMEFILPTAKAWFGDDTGYSEPTPQTLSDEKYWIRAVNEAVPNNTFSDQEVLSDQEEWKQRKSEALRFISRLASSIEYGDVWKGLSGNRLSIQIDECTTLRTQVFDQLCKVQGVSATTNIGGLLAVWQITDQYKTDLADSLNWIDSSLTKAANTSLKLASDIWHHFRNKHYPEDAKERVRQMLIASVRNNATSGDRLHSLLDPNYPFTLYHLVFDSGKDRRSLDEIFSDWGWIRKPIKEAIESGSEVVAQATAILCSTRESGSRGSPFAVDRMIFTGLFWADAQKVIDALRKLKASNNDRQAEVNQFANAAQEALDRNSDVDEVADGGRNPLEAFTEDDDEHADE